MINYKVSCFFKPRNKIAMQVKEPDLNEVSIDSKTFQDVIIPPF
jgi:hypothetical protein